MTPPRGGRTDVLVVGVALALAGCGGGADPGPGPAPTPPPTPAERIQDRLDKRADGFAGGRVAKRLGVEDPHYAVEAIDVDGRRAKLRARFDYSVRGVDGEFGVARILRARRKNGRWRVSDPKGARNVDPWRIDDYRRVVTPDFVVWTPRDLPVPELALDEGCDRMERALRRARLKDRYLVIVARDAAATRRLTQTIAGVESLTALTDTQVRVRGPALRVTAIKSQRLIVNHARFSAVTLDQQISTITHELTHAALAPQTSGRVPAWLIEGLALYVSDDDRRQEADYFRSLGLAPTLASLSAPDIIARLTGDLQDAAYAEASAAAYNVALEHGRDKLLELYLEFNDPSLKGERGSARMVRRAVRRVLGVDLDEI